MPGPTQAPPWVGPPTSGQRQHDSAARRSQAARAPPKARRGRGRYAWRSKAHLRLPPPGWLCGLLDVDIVLAVADAAGEGFPLGRGEGKNGAGRVLGIPYTHAAVGGEGDF